MKKSLLSLTMVAMLSVSAVAQQGSKWLGGAFTYSSEEDENELESSSVTFSPQFGYYLNDKWAIGIGLNLSSSTKEKANGTDYKTSGFGIMPLVRYRCVDAGKFSFFGQGELLFQSYKTTDEQLIGNDIEGDYKVNSLSVKPGVAYNISNKCAIEMLMPNIFNYYSYSGDMKGNGVSFIFNSGYSIENYFLTPTFAFVYKF